MSDKGDNRPVSAVIDNEYKRALIQHHTHDLLWYATLRPYRRQVIDIILEEDVSPELINLAYNSG